MSHTPKFDAKIRKILAASMAGERTCMLTGERWNMTVEDLDWHKKFLVPPSFYAPLTWMRILTAFFVGYQWWNNKSTSDGKPLITTTHPGSGVKVLPDEAWMAADFSSIHLPDDPATSVVGKVGFLRERIPFMAFRNAVPPIHSISTISMGDENSYFMNACRSKDSFFGMNALDTERSAEVYQSGHISDSYNVVHSERIHGSWFVQESRDCLNSKFLFDCRDCEDCFLATNKRRARFVFENRQLSEGEYRAKVAAIHLTKRSVLEEYERRFREMIVREAVWPENFNDRAEASSGEYLLETTRCLSCYNNNYGCHDQRNCAYMFHETSENMFAVGLFYGSNHCYGCTTGAKTSQAKFCYLVVGCQNMEYSMHCYNCEDCFGCVGLNRKRFCIFNRQYTEEEYYRQVDDIKCRMLEAGEYGKFFPVSFSPTRFLDSGAALFFLSGEKEARELGALSYAPESFGASGEVSESALRSCEDIPSDLADLAETWAGVPIYDEGVARRFTFLKPEIAFYHRLLIAPPGRHFIARVRDMAFRANSGVFEKNACAKCQKEILVAKNAAFPSRRIFCRPCYDTFMSSA